MRSRFTPIIWAASGSWATARMAAPVRVRLIRRSTETIARPAMARMARFSYRMVTPAASNPPAGRSCGKGFGSAPRG